jgi:8-oxo-dGTP diphosphatase
VSQADPSSTTMQYPDGRYRTVIGVHLILQRNHTVLLGLRAGTGWRDQHYHVPAGHLEAGETVTECAVREAAEELNIRIAEEDLQLAHTVHHATVEDDPRIQLFFRAQRWEGEPVNAEPDRCARLDWWPLDALPAPMVDYTAVALRHVQDGQPFSIVGWDARP